MIVILVWLFLMGGAVGSFLNVVVYRLPLGLSLIYPPSHCPKCSKRIPWYDNVPILGWIMLRGRCRQCHNPISARYPLVEAITAAIFLALALVEIDQLAEAYPLHVLLLCTLLSAALIEYDGNRVPWKLFIPALMVGLVVQIGWPRLQAMPPLGEARGWIAAAGALGVVAWIVLAGWKSQREQAPTGPVLGLASVGMCLGWQTLVIAPIAAACYLAVLLVHRVWPKVCIPPTALLGAVTLGWLLAWARLVSY
jgi:leader peptidase (prepilin peptidase) / N-methyltransferase